MGRAKSKTNPLEPPKKPKPTTPKPTKRLRKPTPNKPKPTAPKPTIRHRRRHGSDWGVDMAVLVWNIFFKRPNTEN